MAQSVKIIDISRSYVPIDPRSFPESMHGTGAEDAPEGRIPSVPYDGYNFMPTAYGYMSYFGINSILGVNPLTKLTSPFDLLNVDDVFIVQTSDLRNIMVALCEDGIYTKYAASTGAWSHDITLTEPTFGLHKNWTKCVIGNEIYLYRAGELNVWVMRLAEDFVPTALTPSSNMNMSAQQGIFKAGGRLGMWDSANSIAWSDIDDKMDFVIDLETGAGASVFQQIVGKIVACIQHGNGFMIYCTRSIIVVRRGADANFFWLSEAVFNENGISYLNEVAMGQPDTTHFAYTTFGIVQINDGKAEYIIPEVFTYFKENRDPVYLRLLEGRYLFFQFLSGSYLLGTPNFSQGVVPATTFTFKGASYNIDHISDNPCKAIRSVDSSLQGAYLYDTYGYTVKTQATTPGLTPVWEDNLSINFPIADMKIYKAAGITGSGSPDYFDNTGFTQGIVGNVATIPTNGPPLISAYTTPITVPINLQEENTQGFYAKQDWLWIYEQRLFADWKDAISRKNHGETVTTGSAYISSGVLPFSVRTTYEFGPYIDLSFFSESNKYYGISASRKSAWLQRSLTKGIKIKITEIRTYSGTEGSVVGGITPEAIALATSPFSSYTNNLIGGNFPPLTGTWFVAPRSDSADRYVYGVYRDAGFTDGLGTLTYFKPDPDGNIATNFTFPEIGAVLHNITNPTATQSFERPIFESVDYPVCVYKNLGYIQISGHGHYTLDGTFITDDTTPEAADYTDQCDLSPTKSKRVLFNGVTIPSSIPIGCLSQEVVIDSETFTWPDTTITLPPSSFLMQDGSIEPIYPTFQGAFVYDLQYKKWGKCGQPHKLLLNYSPINSQAGDKPIPADIFNVNAGCLLEDGAIALFDKYPADSIIKIGKIGYYRQGFTDCEEVRVQFRTAATGSIIVEGSFDGKNIEPAISQIESYVNVNEVVGRFSNSARWFNVCIQGIYDIKNVDFDGNKKGKR